MRIFEITLFGASFGPTWYGLMYALAFVGAWALLSWRGPFSKKQLDDLVFWALLGVVVGGRLGYVLIYNLPYYLAHPVEILMPWKGGMSFHGGLAGVITVMIVFARKQKMSFWKVADACAWVTPIGLMLGRIGNYVNGELLGWKGYAGPLAVVRDGATYFPTPLLEAGLEGVVLFAVTSWAYFGTLRKTAPSRSPLHSSLTVPPAYGSLRDSLFARIVSFLGGSKKANKASSLRSAAGAAAIHAISPGRTALLFLAGYAIARFIAEFFRDPDPQVGYLLGGWLTAGQGLSAAMALATIIIYACKSKIYGG